MTPWRSYSVSQHTYLNHRKPSSWRPVRSEERSTSRTEESPDAESPRLSVDTTKVGREHW